MHGIHNNNEILQVGSIFECWLEDGREEWKASTYGVYRLTYEKYIRPFWKDRKAAEIEKKDYYNYKAYINDGRGRGENMTQIQNVFRQGMEYGKENYGINYVEIKLKRKRKDSPLEFPSVDSVKVLADYLKKNREDDTCMGILLCLYTGIRLGELCALQWKDINLEEGVLIIKKTMERIKQYEDETNKTKIMIDKPKSFTSNRLIPIPETILRLLTENQGRPEEYVVKGKRKEYAEPRTMQYRFKKILSSLQLPYFNFHKTRHVFASNCINSGFDPKTTSELLGHTDVYLTMNRYVHPDLQRKKMLMETYMLQ